MEPTFEITYLLVSLFLSIYVIIKSKGRIPYLLLAGMGITLVACDAMAIIPKYIGEWCFRLNDIYLIVGIGRDVIGITMTVIFALIYVSYRVIKKEEVNPAMDWFVSALAAIRIILCLIPENLFQFSESLYRNIPFIALCFIVTYTSFKLGQYKTNDFIDDIEATFASALCCYTAFTGIVNKNFYVIAISIIVLVIISSISFIGLKTIRKQE